MSLQAGLFRTDLAACRRRLCPAQLHAAHLLQAHCLASQQVPEEHVGQVVDLMGQRKAQMVDMTAGRRIRRGWML